jgi:DNA-3-methyladenine glycosylase II
MTIIDSEDVLTAHLDALIVQDPLIGRLVTAGAKPPLRRRTAGFADLVAIIIAQQLSTASADAIGKRLTARFPDLAPADIAAADEAELRAAGLSAGKIKTLKALAGAITAGDLVLEDLHRLSAEEAERALVAVHGIGRWTAEVYLLFCTGHPDILPAGDLALQEAARLALGAEWPHDRRPTDKELRAIGERWRPWRGTAARVLWAYYRLAKGREGIIPATPVAASDAAAGRTGAKGRRRGAANPKPA